MSQTRTHSSMPAYFSEDDISLDVFKNICEQQTNLADYPHAKSVAQNILIYDGLSIREKLTQQDLTDALRHEFATALKDGPGVLSNQGRIRRFICD